MIYLYGLIDCEAPPQTEHLAGVTGPVTATRLARGWLIHGPADSDDILPKRRHLLAHARVLENLMPEGTVLPMRFGLFADSVAQFAEVITEGAEGIAAQFDRLAGRVEIGLRIAFPRDAALSAALVADPGLHREHERLSRLARPPHFAVAEFGRRLAEALDARRGAVQRRIVAALRDQWEDHVLKTPGSDVEVLHAECLVAAAGTDRIGQLAQATAQAARDFAGGAEPVVRLVGPAPPFHFVRLSLGRHEPVEA